VVYFYLLKWSLLRLLLDRLHVCCFKDFQIVTGFNTYWILRAIFHCSCISGSKITQLTFHAHVKWTSKIRIKNWNNKTWMIINDPRLTSQFHIKINKTQNLLQSSSNHKKLIFIILSIKNSFWPQFMHRQSELPCTLTCFLSHPLTAISCINFFSRINFNIHWNFSCHEKEIKVAPNLLHCVPRKKNYCSSKLKIKMFILLKA